jgi:mannose-6-phosphate isomerase
MTTTERTAFTAMTHVDKPWGYEKIFALVPGMYCGKVLHVRAGEALSLQYHVEKDEVIALWSGQAQLDVGPDLDSLQTLDMLPGDTIHLRPGTIHRLRATTDILALEASTTQLDDVVRLQDGYGRAAVSGPRPGSA